MSNVAALSILALTVGLSLGRPSLGRFRLHHASAAVIGSLLTIALGIVSLGALVQALQLLVFPIITIVSLMIITLVTERAGLFAILARFIAMSARGDGRKLFAYIFFSGALAGTVFTNDAAVLIFTPLVFHLIEEIQDDSWSLSHKLPYYFAVLYVANLVGALVISNPINIIVSSIFGLSFVDYALWMVLPATTSVAISFVGLRLFFRRSIPWRYDCSRIIIPQLKQPGFALLCGVMLLITLVGFFTEPFTRFPIWAIALSSATILLVAHAIARHSELAPVVRGVAWDVIIFVIGIFVVVSGLRSAGVIHYLGGIIMDAFEAEPIRLALATGLAAASFSSIMNNHPTSYIMAGVIQDWSLPALETQRLVLAALIGGDLGPKMLPIGSLAALIWFRILRDRGVYVPYSLYIKIGVPITLTAVVISVMVLNLEFALYELLGP